MPKVIIISDIHIHNYNIHNIYSPTWRLDNYTVLLEFILKYAISYNIKYIINLGDILVYRDKIPTTSLNILHNFLIKLKDNGITFYSIFGNHDYDITYNTISWDIFIKEGYIKLIPEQGYLLNDSIIDKSVPTTSKIYAEYIAINWFYSNTELEQTLQSYHNYTSDYPLFLFGHFIPKQFESYGIDLSDSLFEPYCYVFLGDNHKYKSLNNLVSVGSTLPIDKSETDVHGFIIYDLETNTYTHEPTSHIFNIQKIPYYNDITDDTIVYKEPNTFYRIEITQEEFSKINAKPKNVMFELKLEKQKIDTIEKLDKVKSLEDYIILYSKSKKYTQEQIDFGLKLFRECK